MALSQANRVASVTTPLGGEVLLLFRMIGTEQLGQLFEYELELLSEKNNIDLTKLLGKSMTVKLNFLSGGHRPFNGLVTRISQIGMLGNLFVYRATLSPKPWLLTRSSNCRIMPTKMTVPQIVKDILGKHGFTAVELKLSGTYQPREYCVQYRETDFNFISRLMEEEGIYYFFKHSDSEHTMVLCDAMFAHANVPGSANISYFDIANKERRKEEHVYEWILSQEIQSGAYELNDFDFEAPSASLKSKSAIPGPHAEASKEVYDYPGEYTQASDGTHYVKIRMEEQRCQYEQIQARGNVRRLAVGAKFTLADFPRTDQNREYLAIAANFQIQNNGYESLGVADSIEEFQSAYTVMSTKYVYRPPRLARMPIVQGAQTAIVVGKSGDEITTDKYGRVKVQFHWDRDGKKDENSSCWVRVAQIWAGKNWGAMHIPRHGQEVIVDFLEGNPDCPIITGRVYNAEQMPPYELDANKTQSGIKSRSSKGGTAENFNEIRFEDKKGSEQLFIHAEKNQDIEVEKDETHWVGHDRTKTIDHDETTHVKHDRTETVGNNETISITKNRTEDVGDNESISIGKNRDERVGENETLEVGKNRERKVGEDEKIDIGKNHTIEIGEKRETTVGKDDISQVGKKYYLEAGDEITLKTGDASITMKKDGTIQIKGKDITIIGDGKIGVKASSDLVLKGSKIAEN